jgi:polyhydroxyalkanoate synthase
MRLHTLAAAARASLGRPPIDYVAGPASPHEVVAEWPLARLLRYPARPGAPARPLLVVASLINRYYVLDLLPDLSVIALLAGRGFDVYVLDWKATGAAGPDLTFADYVDGVIQDAARVVARRGGGERTAVLGYCMGGTMAAMFAARHPSLVSALVLLGTPIDFHRSGMLASWTDRSLFDADLLVDAYGNMPPALMQSGFKLMNPLETWSKLITLWSDAADEDRVRHFVALEAWLDDNVAFPGGVYREYIRGLYQENALVRGAFTVGGTTVDLRRIEAPLLDVVALRDRICAPESSRALMTLVGAKDKRLVEFDTGHIGLTASRRSLKELWPTVATWLEER